MQNHAKRWFDNITPANAMAAIAIGVMLIFSASGMKAFADNVQDDIDASVSSSQTITAGGDGLAVKYWIIANGQGGLSGCDASDGSPATVKFEVRKDGSTALTNDVTVTPSSQSFSSCGSENSKTATYKSDTPGIYKVSVSASDSSGSYNTNPAEFTLTVKAAADTTAPVLTLPDDKTVEATSADGAEVTYTATAEDDVDGPVDVSCTPASGSTFPLGETTVECSATDEAGNEATGSFKVTVTKPADTTAPVLTLPDDKTVEATSADGAEVTYTATAEDDVDGPVDVSCTPASGSTFPLGETTVECSATDEAGNEATGSFNVIVQDTTPPELTLPSAPPAAEATSPQGAAVTYEAATATDLVDGEVEATCEPASGSTFPLGTTPVNCTATDAAGNEATGSFNVIVQDTIKPVIEITSTISDGQQFYFGDVPSAPTCTATDSGSGVNGNGCEVKGYATTVGPQTLTFTATDNAGNTATQIIKYTVLPWQIKGFYQPVDMNGVQNTVKGGSTVPLKFEVFKGTTELTDVSVIKTPLTAKKVSCTTGTEDAIETLSPTGGTVLRYDATAGQFVYNWQTPKQVGACYDVTVGTQDGSATEVARFKLK